MSGSTAKATRRDIRRALGADGLKSVNALGGVIHGAVVPQVDAQRGILQQHARNLDDLTETANGHTVIIDDLTMRQCQLESRIMELELSMWQRVKRGIVRPVLSFLG